MPAPGRADAGRGRSDISKLKQHIKDEEQTALLKAHGKIETRKRFKHSSGNQLLEGRPSNRLYFDESGSPNASDHPNDQPFFALGAIAISAEEELAYRKRADEIKMEFLGKSSVTFHEPKMSFRIFQLGGRLSEYPRYAVITFARNAHRAQPTCGGRRLRRRQCRGGGSRLSLQ